METRRGGYLLSLLLLGSCHEAPGISVAGPAPQAQGHEQSKLAFLRGPYLQMATPQSIVLRWRSSQATSSKVRYGTSATALTQVAEQTGRRRDHELLVQGLAPNTTYYYAVEEARGQVSSFTTPPVPGTEAATQVWVLGDSGTMRPEQYAVRDAYYRYARQQKTDLWIMLGDNAYSKGTEAQYQKAVFEAYPDMLRTTPLWTIIGNHDRDAALYEQLFSLPKRAEAGGVPSGSESYYSFDYANIHFVALDSYRESRSAQGRMAKWLQADLAANKQMWTVAIWHHPPYTKGGHDSDKERDLIEMRSTFVPILDQGGVDLLLSGHSHGYERSSLIAGHYGPASSFDSSMQVDAGDGHPEGDGAYRKALGRGSKGVVYVVAGSSGQVESAAYDHPAMLVNHARLGSLVLTVEGKKLAVRFLLTDGSIGDQFAIVKEDLK